MSAFIELFTQPGKNKTLLNLQLHATLIYCVLFTFGVLNPQHRIEAAAVAFAFSAVKEFWFDMRYEIPPQPVGTLSGGGALQDFVGYCIGILAAGAFWLFD